MKLSFPCPLCCSSPLTDSQDGIALGSELWNWDCANTTSPERGMSLGMSKAHWLLQSSGYRRMHHWHFFGHKAFAVACAGLAVDWACHSCSWSMEPSWFCYSDVDCCTVLVGLVMKLCLQRPYSQGCHLLQRCHCPGPWLFFLPYHLVMPCIVLIAFCYGYSCNNSNL